MRRQLLANLFEGAARWIFYAALVFAPWAYGATTPWAITRLNWMLMVGLGCWVVELVIDGRVPRLSLVLVAASALVLALGWWMVINATSIRDWQYEMFVPRRQILPGATGSIDYALSAAFMLRVTLLLGSVWFVVDGMRQPKFVLELWWVIVIAGTSISLLGLLQKATSAEMIFWARATGPEPPPTTFFATYYYHANAGAFLNLTWPFAGGLALRSIDRNSHPAIRALLVSFFVIDLVAVMANTSRMAQLVATLLLLLLLVVFVSSLWKSAAQMPWQLSAASVVFIVTVVGAIAYSSQWEQALLRWQMTTATSGPGGRWDAAQVGWTAAKAAGWFGFGPGVFRAVFPRFQDPTELDGRWIFLHQDYLQTIIEWGWFGAAAWAVLFFGGIVNGVVELWRKGRRMLPRYRIVVRLAVIALSGVALHSLVDFPLQIASVQLYAAVCAGFAWGWRAPS
jgi:O-Antigen ligase